MSASSQADGGGELSGERYLRLYRDEQVRRFKAEQENAELRLDRDQWIDVCRHAEEERDAAEQSRKDAEEQLEQTRTDAYNRIMEAREKVRKAEEQAHALSIDSAHKIVALKAAEERLAQVTEALRSALNANFTGGHGEDGTLIRPGCTCWFCYGHSRLTPPAAPDGPARCGVVGYPQGERHACELERDHADDYHAQGGVRWIGYFKTPPEEPPAASSQDSEKCWTCGGQPTHDCICNGSGLHVDEVRAMRTELLMRRGELPGEPPDEKREEPILKLTAHCKGRYPVPGRRSEPFPVTYRCGKPDGHEGEHGQ